MSKIYVLIDDKKRGSPPKTYYELRKEEFETLNKKNYGIYFAVNEFDHNEEKAKALGVKTFRNNGLIKTLRYVYADLDIAKAGDGKTREEKQAKKEIIKKALISYAPPSFIIDTSNGIQPLWEITDGVGPTEETKLKYTNAIKGVIEWSKQYGCMADNVHDLARILRVPGYYHQKEEPYLCEIVYKSSTKTVIDEFAALFPFEEKTKEKVNTQSTYRLSPVDQAIAEIDIKDIVIRAFGSTGRIASFDSNDEVVLDDRKTGTHQGRTGDRQFIATSSHEPFKGNKITVVADILGITNKEARKWIIDEFHLDYAKLQKNSLINPKNEKPKTDEARFTWGTRNTDIGLGIMKRGELVVIAARRGNGKTTYTFDIAQKNAHKGYKVLYISLEMSAEMIKEDFSRKYAGWTLEEEYDFKIPDFKINAFKRRKKELSEVPNLYFEGIRRGAGAKWTDILETINKYENLDLVFIDNLDLISSDKQEDNNERQKMIINNLMGFTAERNITIILIHHLRKSSGNKDYGMDELSGSGKISDGADKVLKITHDPKPDEDYPDKYKTKINMLKVRGYHPSTRDVYFIRGTFVDEAPPEEYKTKLQFEDIEKMFKT